MMFDMSAKPSTQRSHVKRNRLITVIMVLPNQSMMNLRGIGGDDAAIVMATMILLLLVLLTTTMTS